MHVDPPTFGQLAPIIEYACQQHGIELYDRPSVEKLAKQVLVTIGYHPADASTNAITLALMVYEARGS